MTTPLPPAGSPPPPPPPGAAAEVPTPGTQWWSRAVPIWAVALIALVSLAVGAAVTSGDDPEDAAAIVESEAGDSGADRGAEATTRERETSTTRATTTTRPTTTTTAAAEVGTRENPFPAGTPLVTNDGLEVMITGINLDAAGVIAAENRFNDPQPPGMRFVMVHVTLTNNSDESIHPWLAVDVEAIGSQNRVHGSCRQVLPDSLNDAPELYPGGSAAGNVCLTVPEDELADGSLLLMVAPSFGDPVFSQPQGS